MQRIPYGTAIDVVRELKSRLRFCFISDRCLRMKLVIAGSMRRRKETIKDIDILVVMPSRYKKYKEMILGSAKLVEAKAGIIQSMTVKPTMKGTIHHGFNLKIKGVGKPVALDLFLVSETTLPFALFHYTGDKTFNIRTRAHVKKMGMLMNQYGLFDAQSGKKIRAKIASERDIFKFIGVTYKPPRARSENDK